MDMFFVSRKIHYSLAQNGLKVKDDQHKKTKKEKQLNQNNRHHEYLWENHSAKRWSFPLI